MIVDRAHEIADAVLFPRALEVDAADRVPASHLDLLASEGFYGLRRGDFRTLAGVTEALAGGDLATTFVWLQHHSPVAAAAAAGREDLLAALAAGERRAGIALAGLRSPDNPMRVRPSEGGFVLTGTVPWVTGWDMIDTLYVAARGDDDAIYFLAIDAVASATLVPSAPLRLVAVQASRTVNITFADHPVPADRLLSTQPAAEWSSGDATGSVLNGFLSVGLAARCVRLLGPGPLDAAVADAREALLASADDPATVPAARAQASELAMRAASALAVSTGARAVLRDQHAQRLVREATFLLVFGSRLAIKERLLAQFRAA